MLSASSTKILVSDVKIIPVVGVTFVASYPANLHQLQALYDWQAQATQASEALPQGIKVEPLSVVLRRNPANRHDSNAIEVHVPALGDDAMIGHFSRENAAIVAPMMDRGQRFKASVYRCRITKGQENRPGIDIEVTRLPKEDL